MATPVKLKPGMIVVALDPRLPTRFLRVSVPAGHRGKWVVRNTRTERRTTIDERLVHPADSTGVSGMRLARKGES